MFYLQVTSRCCLGAVGTPLLPEAVRHGWWAPRCLFQPPGIVPNLSACSQGHSLSEMYACLSDAHTGMGICIDQYHSLTVLQLTSGNHFWPHGFISSYLGQWLPTLLSYCYIKKYSIFSQAESYWLHSSALIRYVIRSYFLELSIDQRCDQWQPLNISKSIFPEIYSFKKA